AVTCWGAGDAGQLGQGAPSSALVPGPAVELPGAASAVAAGDDFTCALLIDGRVFCWGDGAQGQLGTGDRSSRAAPGAAPVALPKRARAVSAGGAHACARLEDQTLACWGANQAGQLGLGDGEDRPRPALVPLGSSLVLAVA